MADIGNRLDTFDTLTTGANIVSGDLPSGWTVTGSGGTLTVVAKTWTHGTKGAQFNNATTSRAFIESGSYGTGVACQWVYFILDSISATAIILSGGTGSANWRLNANRTVQARNNTTAVGSASGVIITADGTTVYRAEHSTNPGAGTQQLKIFAADDNASPLYDSGSQTLVGTTRTNYQFGATAAAAGVVITILAAGAVDTAFSGPLPLPAAGTGSLTLSATGAATGPGTTATASLSLSASGAGKGVAAGTGSLTLAATGDATPPSTFTFVPKYPVTAAHRGGMPNGEETWEAYDYSLALVPDVALEYDLTELSDGKFACLHDVDVDRTADASSPITTGLASSLTSTQFRTVIMTPQSGGGVVGLGRIMDDMASRYTTQLHLPEIKTGSNYTTATAQIISLGLASHSIVQSFSYTAATYAASQGLEVVYEMAGGDAHTFAAMKAAGINHVMRNKTLWTAPDITSAKAAGLKTWIFTVDTTSERDTWLANGIDGGFISGQPATIHMTAMGSGSITLSASGAAKGAGAGSAALSLSATGAAKGGAAGTAALTLTGTGATTSPAAATAALSLSATGATKATGAGAGALSLTATGAATSPAAGTASLTLTATGAGRAPAAGTGAISLTATGAGAATATGAAALTLAATGTAVGPGGAAGTGSLSLSASGAARATGAGTAAITLSGAGSPGAPVTGTAALTLFAAATARAAIQGFAAITLAATGAGRAPGAGTGAIVLSATGTASAGGVVVVTPPSRIYPIPIEVRVMTIGRETRVYPVPAATRVLEAT